MYISRGVDLPTGRRLWVITVLESDGRRQRRAITKSKSLGLIDVLHQVFLIGTRCAGEDRVRKCDRLQERKLIERGRLDLTPRPAHDCLLETNKMVERAHRG